MRKLIAIPALTALLAAPAVYAEGPMAVPVKKMTLESAQAIAMNTIKACRAKGIQIGVTVMDRDGIVQAQLRDTVAPPITLPISQGKAYAATMFRVPSSQLVDRANTAVGRAPGVIMSAGAVPIDVGGEFLGAVGVSGAPGGDIDEACAAEGLAPVKEELEMSMM
ncbi:GlcG/HbpS family heme-binding protein [Magnetofaba australis]|uniref:Adenosylcobalamin biosynthesis, GlcG-related protein n=1 Tax=Magnetofaba australis IT-1 TaxID=1434232 RepID=A0A1Y2K2T5_9PROT|nr:heme-binding protein [Magnetofaba australis]OSM01494.1 hypothetical protein MAIT1_01475 [Magnetofaba australis IT-1]